MAVPTYNRRANLPRVLAPVLADPALHRLLVVVDGSDDGSIEWLRSLAADDPRVVPIWTDNGGQGRARQLAAESSDADFVLFLDDDVLAGDGLVGRHLAAQQAQPGLVLGYMPIDTGPRTAANVATYLYAAEYEKRCRTYDDDPGRVLQNLWAGNLSLPREDAVALPMYAPDFAGLLHEDRSLGMRCIQRGLAASFDRELAATHLHQRSVEQFYRDCLRQAHGNQQLAARYPGQFAPSTADRSGVELLPAALRRPVAPLLRSPGVRALVRTALLRLIALTGRLGLYDVQTPLTKLLRRFAYLEAGTA